MGRAELRMVGLWIVATFLAGSSLAARPADEVLLVVVLGQSNASGREDAARLANPTYNPARYQRAPDGIFVFVPGAHPLWQAYRAGINSRPEPPRRAHFGLELALSQRLRRATGKPVYLVKATYGATALTRGIPTAPPGDWTSFGMPVAIEGVVLPAVRALRARHTGRVRFLGVVWWQGETDAVAGVSQSHYQAAFSALKTAVDGRLTPILGEYRWAVVGLNYLQTRQESIVNAALCNAAQADDVAYIPTAGLPRRMDLTALQRRPLPRTADDDEHASYVAHFAVGEAIADRFLERTSVSDDCRSVD